MFNVTRLMLIFPVILMIPGTSCTKKDAHETPAGLTCHIAAPLTGDSILIGNTVTISVETNQSSDKISEVRFFVDEIGISSVSNFPFTSDWNTSAASKGIHTIKVTTFDISQHSSSDEINVYLKEEENTARDYDGNVYHVIRIGGQQWMQENLRVTHFRNGEEIPLATDDFTWINTASEYCYYDNDQNIPEIYGMLYNFQVVSDSRVLPRRAGTSRRPQNGKNSSISWADH